MIFNKIPSIVKSDINESDIIGDKKKFISNEANDEMFHQKKTIVVADSSLINTVPWKIHIEKKFDWIGNMIHHIRYRDQEMKYKLKDIKLLELGWKSICNTNEQINEESCRVIPLEETSKGIQKKYKNMIRAHLSDWILQHNQCFSFQNNPNFYIKAEGVNMCTKLIESIMKNLPAVDGKVVLDLQRIKKGTGITVKQWIDEYNQREHVHRIIIDTHYSLFRAMDYQDASETTLIKECNKILNLFPRKLDEKCYTKNQDFFFPPSALYVIGFIMAKALYINKSSLTTLHGCAAAIRLWSEYQDLDMQDYLSYNFPMLVPMIIYQTVEAQTKENTQRPFFSVNKLKRIEDELGIGIYSMQNLKCNECGAVDDDVKVKLNKCDGCNRVWYCGNKCQEKNWLTHKHVCKNRWRKKKLYLKSKLTYNIMKQMVMKDNNGDGVNFRVQVDVTTGDTFMYCIDPDTNELFDGLTDRPICFLSCSEH